MNPAKLADLFAFLSAKTGKDFSGRDFHSRLRIQKAAYLLRELNYAPLRKYNFSAYFHGPYCPDLTKDYYDLVKGNVKPLGENVVLPPAALAVIPAIAKGNEFLEAASTLHMVARHNKLNRQEATQRVQAMKPHLGKSTLEDAWEWLEAQRLSTAT